MVYQINQDFTQNKKKSRLKFEKDTLNNFLELKNEWIINSKHRKQISKDGHKRGRKLIILLILL